jgi:hypothetical protein
MIVKPVQSVQMERIVRPFVVIDSAPPPPPTPRKPLPGEDDDAFIAWGGPSRFVRPELTQPLVSDSPIGSGGSLIVTWPKDPKEKDEEQQRERVYREIDRKTVKRRVTNPQDAQQWVDVEDTTEIRLRAPDGGTVRFIFRPRP